MEVNFPMNRLRKRLTTLVARVVRFAARRVLAAIALVLPIALPVQAQEPNPTSDASLVDAAPFLLPYFNNGPVFGLPGTVGGDVWHRTQLSGDWGGVRTDLARRGWFVDLYSTGAYQDVARGGLKTGSAFVQNTQLS